jgi:hypothetical protein
LLDGYGGPIASLTADGAYDRDDVYAAVAARSRRAAVVIPPRSSAVRSTAGGTPPTQRDEHIVGIEAHGRMGWQRRDYNWRALVETDVSRWKRVIGGELRSRTDDRRSTEVAIAVCALGWRVRERRRHGRRTLQNATPLHRDYRRWLSSADPRKSLDVRRCDPTIGHTR